MDQRNQPARVPRRDHPHLARARAEARIRHLTRATILVAGGVTAFIGVTVAREHPGAAAGSKPPVPLPAPQGTSGTTPSTTTTSPPTTTTTQPVVTSGGTSR